ncbi:phosphonate metabolism protein/1,5-bisphosphokinase (PRPP-forming) PhnN [Gammaproteobacteria bacterium]|nr:phosphonate metabolism protein/1,5-bisphosphokinase (PRPP-forming) PhnN [Gammaproteobacteria bacterium]
MSKSKGCLIAIVGPSGAGKDRLLSALLQRVPALRIARRVIDRQDAAGGEEYEAISREAFELRRQQGDFAVHWYAHGNAYGIPQTIDHWLAAGETVLFNGSRRALLQSQQRYPQLGVIHITAAPAVLAQRLAGRGRETAQAIDARLRDADLELPLEAIVINNEGSVDDALAQLLTAVETLQARSISGR